MKRKLKEKILIICLMVLTILSVFQNYIYATEIDSATILNGGDCGLHLQFNAGSGWSYVTTTYTYYNYNGQEYPAYCLNRELPRCRRS